MKEQIRLSVLTNHGLAKFPIQQTSELLFEQNFLFATVGGILLTKDSNLRKIKLSNKFLRISQRSRNIASKDKIKISLLGEAFWQLYLFARQRNFSENIQGILILISFSAVDLKAFRILKRAKPGEIDIYHCRSGFGRKSLKLARSLGIITICEHTTAHPDFSLNLESKRNQSQFRIEKLTRSDLQNANYILIPSKWVANTFNNFSNFHNLTILTPPIDSEFRKYLSSVSEFPRNIDVLFVGYVSELKGFSRLNSIVSALPSSINVSIVGNWDPNLLNERMMLTKRGNISIHGYLEHIDIARIMKRSKILLFPSLIEGAARVVDEAIYAGCLIMASAASFADENIHAINIDGLDDREVLEKTKYFLENEDSRTLIASAALRELQAKDLRYYNDLIRFYENVKKKRNYHQFGNRN